MQRQEPLDEPARRGGELAGAPDADARARRRRLDDDLDHSAIGRGAQRRQRQHAHHLLEPPRIGGDGADARIDRALDQHAALGAERAQLVDRLRHRAAGVDGAHAQAQLAGGG